MVVGLVCALASAAAAEDTATKTAVPFKAGAEDFHRQDGRQSGRVPAGRTQKKHVPVIVVLEVEQADFVMMGASSERKGAWHEGWLSAEKDHATGSCGSSTRRPRGCVGRRSRATQPAVGFDGPRW